MAESPSVPVEDADDLTLLDEIARLIGSGMVIRQGPHEIAATVLLTLASEVGDHPGPNPSPASPAWWAGYIECRDNLAAMLREAGQNGQSDD